MEIFLSDSARGAMEDITKTVTKPVGLIICPEAKTGVYTIQFIDYPTLHLLNTTWLGEVLPGVHVYIFGHEKLPPDKTLELHAIPAHTRAKQNDSNEIIALGYLFTVRIKPKPFGVKSVSIAS